MLVAGAIAPNLGLLDDLGVLNGLCLPGALGSDLVVASTQAVRSECPSNRPLRLLYAGGLDISKGIDRFLEAVELVDFPLEIHVCGHGPHDGAIRGLCSSSRHDVTFHGLVSRDELIGQMVQADVGINPHRSDLHRGGSWPFKVVEYLAACGTVFCNASGAVPREMTRQMFMYHADDPEGIAAAFTSLVESWPGLSTAAPQRRKWAIDRFGPDGLADQLDGLIHGDALHGVAP
ncbi:MAG: glycosyltransferase [Thermoleophilia bacterium]